MRFHICSEPQRKAPGRKRYDVYVTVRKDTTNLIIADSAVRVNSFRTRFRIYCKYFFLARNPAPAGIRAEALYPV